jgi:dynein heavy chain 1
MSQLRDVPPISGAIIWARQIDRQLSTYMRRVEDVLGKGWELYAEGQKLQSESTSFRRKLDTRPVYEAWLHEIQRRDLQIAGRLFDIVRVRGGGGQQLQLIVNFDPQIITLFKEVRNLLWLGFSVQHQISNIAKDAKVRTQQATSTSLGSVTAQRVYPHAVSLMETVRTYSQTCDRVASNSGIAPLVAEYRSDAQAMIAKGAAASPVPPIGIRNERT